MTRGLTPRQGKGREDGATPEAHRSPEARGDQAPRPRRRNAGRDWPQLQRVGLDNFEAGTVTEPLRCVFHGNVQKIEPRFPAMFDRFGIANLHEDRPK